MAELIAEVALAIDGRGRDRQCIEELTRRIGAELRPGKNSWEPMSAKVSNEWGELEVRFNTLTRVIKLIFRGKAGYLEELERLADGVASCGARKTKEEVIIDIINASDKLEEIGLGLLRKGYLVIYLNREGYLDSLIATRGEERVAILGDKLDVEARGLAKAYQMALSLAREFGVVRK